MKKLLLAPLVVRLLLFSFKSNATWNYCNHEVQTTTDSWSVYISKTSSGDPLETTVQTQFRYSRYDGVTGIYTLTDWANLPSGGYIGGTGFGTGIYNIEIREINFWTGGVPHTAGKIKPSLGCIF